MGIRMFYNNAGRLSVIKTDALPSLLKLGNFSSGVVLVTKVGLSQHANVQIQPSLKEAIYVYSVGDAPGELTIGGICFITDQQVGPAGDGVADVLKYYAAHRVSKSLKHVNVAIGKTNLAGFLLAVTVGTGDPATRVFEWGLQMVALPNFEGLAAAAPGEGDPGSASANPSPESGGGGSGMNAVTDPAAANQTQADAAAIRDANIMAESAGGVPTESTGSGDVPYTGGEVAGSTFSGNDEEPLSWNHPDELVAGFSD